MNLYHIDRRSAPNGEEHLAKSQMQHRRHKDSCDLRNTVRAAKEVCILEAVDDEHPKDGGGEDVAEVADNGRRRLLLREQEEGEGAR